MDRQTILNSLDIRTFYVSELSSLKTNGDNKAIALCPLHEDTNPSLSVNLSTGQWNCLAGCGGGSVFDFYMKRHGCDYRTAFNALADRAGLKASPASKIVDTYPYRDTEGKVLFEVVRYEPKSFRQRRPDNKGGWIWNLQGIELVPFNLQAVIPAKSVLIVEGEKDVLSLKGIGLVATCSAMGAGKWRKEYNQWFRGKKVAILPDNDEPGRKHAEQVARSLHGIAESVKVVEIPGLPPKGDVSDWIQAGGTCEQLLEFMKNTPAYDLSESPDIGGGQLDNAVFTPLSALQRGADLRTIECCIEWCIDRLLPKQSITLLHGRGGIGKTWVCLVLADSISRGIPFMGLDTQKMSVVFIDFENSLPVLVDRIRKIGADDVLFWHNANEEMKPPKLDSLDAEAYKHLPKGSLLVFDTLRASQSKDENNSQDMAVIMSKLKDLRDMDFTILLLHHTPKGNDRTYKGSTAILDLADHVLSLHKVKKGNPEGGEVEDEDDQECLYRLGTKDKTRYEPFHVFMAFDKERGFVKAEDPDELDLQGIYHFLKEKPRLNQGNIFELAKDELDIKSKGKVISLLKKGEGRYWTSTREGKAVFYQAIGCVHVSDPIYRTDGQINPTLLEPVRDFRTDDQTNTPETLDGSQLSNCLAPYWTERTDEVIEVLDLSEEAL
ncbi:MAG: AAA family ATPase [Alphaproteobacteria bacterium]|uniref:AAA family ATPase n=1 Tax=Candidatus Nitrobium versatile TaxID=2884831 RepID=A0A953JAC3_9BACT|nr:AAA family ATPase [Candidatus Nitrobium versatile]